MHSLDPRPKMSASAEERRATQGGGDAVHTQPHVEYRPRIVLHLPVRHAPGKSPRRCGTRERVRCHPDAAIGEPDRLRVVRRRATAAGGWDGCRVPADESWVQRPPASPRRPVPRSGARRPSPDRTRMRDVAHVRRRLQGVSKPIRYAVVAQPTTSRHFK